MQYPITERRVPSAGLEICVREHSAPRAGKPHVVLVHGYPNRQELWRRTIAELDLDDVHVVTYDVRGAGASDAPADQDGYRTELLVEDLVAVVESTVPEGESVHLVGHDWGSVQLWDVVAAEAADPRLRGRVASFTSISGPSLDHVAHLIRHRDGRELRLLNQSVRSSYVSFFHLPVLPELLWTGPGRLAGINPDDARNGLNLYRANIRRRMRHPGELRTDVPVQVVQPRRDPFVTEVMLEDLELACSDLTIAYVDAGHWVPRSHPRELAALVTQHVRESAG